MSSIIGHIASLLSKEKCEWLEVVRLTKNSQRHVLTLGHGG